METLQCIIADDEPIARQILENYIEAIPHLELSASCKNAFEVMEVLQSTPIDILFLDINMPKLSGISLLKTMQHTPHVIITTAYPEYALQGFELSVTDYLLKPFSLERCIQAVLKVKQPRNEGSTHVVQAETASANKEETPTALFVKSDKKIIKVDFDDIQYVEAYGNYIKIYTDQMILTSQTLSDFLEKLPHNFLRIHKSYVINFNALQLIDGNQIILQNKVKLPIGKLYKKDVLNRI